MPTLLEIALKQLYTTLSLNISHAARCENSQPTPSSPNPMKETLLAAATPAKAYSPNEVFFCPEESQFYSQCLEKMVLPQCMPDETVIEFGTGDGSPVINALLKTRFHGSILGYELNTAAYQLAQTRIEQYCLHDQFRVHNQCFFSNASSQADYLIANPPYLPAPDNQLYMPSLHGGEDGATITKRLLEMGCDKVMVLISAYSNPIDTVAHAIAHGYDLVDFMISPLPFGYYSREPKVKQAIAELRQQQKAFYSANIYFLSGVLFRKTSPITVDLSEEFLKVMTAL